MSGMVIVLGRAFCPACFRFSGCGFLHLSFLHLLSWFSYDFLVIFRDLVCVT